MDVAKRVVVSFIFLLSCLSAPATCLVNITGCPALSWYEFDPLTTTNVTIPKCFCDNATATTETNILINCLTDSTVHDLTDAINNIKKAGKRVISINLEYMTFDNQLSLPDDYFHKLQVYPEEITISGCQNEKIQLNNSFRGLEHTLKRLAIVNCVMLSVPPSIGGLFSLDRLTLQSTYIYVLQREDFRSLGNLTYIDISGNQMYVIEEGALDPLVNVRTALFGPRNAFNTTNLPEINKLISVTELALNDTNLDQLNGSVFSNLTHLVDFNLGGGYIENITADAFVGLSNLRTLDLRANRISRIDAGAFAPLRNLRQLYLSGNFLNDLEAGIFAGLVQLQELDLDWNELTYVGPSAFGDMSSLEFLRFSRCADLQGIDDTAFKNLHKLRTLNISMANLTTIRPQMLEPLSELRLLDVTSSNLYYLTPDAFRHVPKLEQLSLAATTLIDLPPGIFDPLVNLKVLDLSYVQWLCDDSLAWLVRWLQTHAANITLIDADYIQCWDPLELRGESLLTVDPNSMKPYVAPEQILQPSTTTTTVAYQTTQQGSNFTEAVDPSAPTTTSTSAAPKFGDVNSLQDASNTEPVDRTKIIIAVVVTVGATATVLGAAIVVAVMRRRRRRAQKEDTAQGNEMQPTQRVQPPSNPDMFRNGSSSKQTPEMVTDKTQTETNVEERTKDAPNKPD